MPVSRALTLSKGVQEQFEDPDDEDAEPGGEENELESLPQKYSELCCWFSIYFSEMQAEQAEVITDMFPPTKPSPSDMYVCL